MYSQRVLILFGTGEGLIAVFDLTTERCKTRMFSVEGHKKFSFYCGCGSDVSLECSKQRENYKSHKINGERTHNVALSLP